MIAASKPVVAPKEEPLMRYPRTALLLAFACCAGSAAADHRRGALLYENHCGGCHGEQVHWRDQKLVSDWATLLAEVWRWQYNLKLDWSDADIDAVARHLNRLHYRLPEPDSAS